MSENCNTQTNVPEVDNTGLPCEEFIPSDCVLHPDAFPQLMLPDLSSLTNITTNLYLSLINALVRIEELENLIGIFSIVGLADNDIIQYNGGGAVWENRADISLTDNVSTDRDADAIVLGTASTLSVQDNGASDIMTFDEATGAVNILKGNVVINNISLVQASSRIIINTVSYEETQISRPGNSFELEADTLILNSGQINANGDVSIVGGDLNVTNDINITGGGTIDAFAGLLRLDATGTVALLINGTQKLGATATVINILVNTNFGDNELLNVHSVQARSGAADPTNADIPDGHSAVWRNTTLGETRTWYNNGGTMESSAAFT